MPNFKRTKSHNNADSYITTNRTINDILIEINSSKINCAPISEIEELSFEKRNKKASLPPLNNFGNKIRPISKISSSQ